MLLSFPDWYQNLPDNIKLHVFTLIPFPQAVYRTMHPDWKQEQKNGFLGVSTRRNIIATRYRKHFKFTGSTHITYTLSHYQTRSPFEAFYSLFESRHPGKSFFIRINFTSSIGNNWIQTPSFNYSSGVVLAAIGLIRGLGSTGSGGNDLIFINYLQAVVRL